MGRLGTFQNARLSLFQSLAEEVADPQGGDAEGSRLTLGHELIAAAHAIAGHRRRGEAVPQSPPDFLQRLGGKAPALWSCAKLAAEAMEAGFAHDREKARAKLEELRFGTCDPQWASALVRYEQYFGIAGDRREIPYVRYQSLDDFVIPIAADAKIALLGDWGTGTREAVDVLRRLREHQPDVLIHLGDIYYSGTERECRRYFLDILNRELRSPAAMAGRKTAIYNLAGNHDMYSGGQGYYGLLAKLNPQPGFSPAQAQQASYFCLRSEDGAWQFLALDTSLHDHDLFDVSSDVTYLDPLEEAWHLDKIRRHSAGGGRTVLLSHHQLFSAFKKIGKVAQRPTPEQAANPKLLRSFRAFQQAAAEGSGDIAAWFWGHEHNLEVYRPYLGLAKGRCMGHGAIPQLVQQKPYKPVPEFQDPPRLVDDPRHPGRPLQLDEVDQSYAHGFVILQLGGEGKKARVSYYQLTGDDESASRPMYVEEL